MVMSVFLAGCVNPPTLQDRAMRNLERTRLRSVQFQNATPRKVAAFFANIAATGDTGVSKRGGPYGVRVVGKQLARLADEACISYSATNILARQALEAISSSAQRVEFEVMCDRGLIGIELKQKSAQQPAEELQSGSVLSD